MCAAVPQIEFTTSRFKTPGFVRCVYAVSIAAGHLLRTRRLEDSSMRLSHLATLIAWTIHSHASDVELDVSKHEDNNVTKPMMFSPRWAQEYFSSDEGCTIGRGVYIWRNVGFGSNMNSKCYSTVLCGALIMSDFPPDEDRCCGEPFWQYCINVRFNPSGESMLPERWIIKCFVDH